MKSLEVAGANIDEAIRKALEALGVERDGVDIEILDYATRGLFGLGARPARVRATVRHAGAHAVERMAGSSPGRVSRETPEVSGRYLGGPDRSRVSARACEVLEVVLGYLVDSPGIKEAPPEDGGQTIRLALEGSDTGTVIGRRGQTLDALEHLVNRIVFRDEADSRLRIELDVERYRERRRESLEQLARRLALKARTTRCPVTMNPMSPRDRRVVHLELQSDPAVTTRSEGEGHYRRLVILPQSARQEGERSPSR